MKDFEENEGFIYFLKIDILKKIPLLCIFTFFNYPQKKIWRESSV
jgi:hypothetical protein